MLSYVTTKGKVRVCVTAAVGLLIAGSRRTNRIGAPNQPTAALAGRSSSKFSNTDNSASRYKLWTSLRSGRLPMLFVIGYRRTHSAERLNRLDKQ